MRKNILTIRKECCDIWNNLKDKTKMIDYLIESKLRISELEEQLKKYLERNNDLLKQIMELEVQLIKERLKGEKK